MKQPNTERAFVMVLICFFAGFIWASFKPEAPYLIFCEAAGAAFVALGGKRLVQKLKKFGGNGGETIEIEKTVEKEATDAA